MKFLILDTSGPDSFVSLCDNETCKTKFLSPLKQSQTLLPAIQELLARSQSIDFIAIGVGPGSFTGTRVGVMTAKTLAFALKTPLIPFCSLKIYTPNQEGPFTIFSNAGSNTTFVLKGVRSSQTASFKKPYIKEGEKPLSKELNLPFLGKYLLEKFLQSGGNSSHEVRVCYLKTP